MARLSPGPRFEMNNVHNGMNVKVVQNPGKLGYGCPSCHKAAFYLDGRPGEYKNGTKLEVHEAKRWGRHFKGLKNWDIITCQNCNLPFTTGRLYLKNLGYFDAITGERRG